MRNKFLLIIATVMLFAAKASAQMVAVNTDVAMDACMAPSLGVELTLGKKSNQKDGQVKKLPIISADMITSLKI